MKDSIGIITHLNDAPFVPSATRILIYANSKIQVRISSERLNTYEDVDKFSDLERRRSISILYSCDRQQFIRKTYKKKPEEKRRDTVRSENSSADLFSSSSLVVIKH